MARHWSRLLFEQETLLRRNNFGDGPNSWRQTQRSGSIEQSFKTISMNFQPDGGRFGIKIDGKPPFQTTGGHDWNESHASRRQNGHEEEPLRDEQMIYKRLVNYLILRSSRRTSNPRLLRTDHLLWLENHCHRYKIPTKRRQWNSGQGECRDG